MADRYWVGGSGNWDATTTTNWSATSGGAGGASAPTDLDNVIFDANSNTLLLPFTVTVTGVSGSASLCNDFTASSLDGAMTLSLPATAIVLCYGSMTLPATNFTWSGTSGAIFVFSATTTGKTITTNGVTLTSTQPRFSGVGGEWTFGGAFTNTGNGIVVEAGSIITSNFNITSPSVNASGTSTRSIDLGSSTLTLSFTAPINFSTATGLTFNAGTSQITCSNANPTFAGGGQTFYNVSFTSAANGTTTITGANTFNNFTQTSRNATGNRTLSIAGNQTISGTLTLGAANTAIRRIQVVSDFVSAQRTITLNGSLATLADVDFRDIATAGTVGTWTGTRLGNGLNNSGITFDAAKDVYWNLAAGGNWSATGWATTSGGSPNVNNFPLAQDKVIIENTGLNTSATITINSFWFIGEIDASTRSNAMTLASGVQLPRVYKNVTLSSAVTMTGTGAWQFLGQSTTQVLDVNTATFTPPFNIDSPSGTLQLAENTTCSGIVTLTQGTLDLNDFDLTCNAVSSNNTNTRTLDLGTNGKIAVTGLSFTVNPSGLTMSGTGIVSMDSATDKTFAGGGGVYPYTLNQGDAGNLTITGANTFDNITNTVQPCTITFPANTITTVNNFNVNGTAGNLVSLRSSTPGTQYTLSRNLILDPLFIDVGYLDISDAIGNPDLKWFVGKNSVNSGNNSQIYFSQIPATNININGSATITAKGAIVKLSNATILGQALFSASSNVLVFTSVSVIGEASVIAFAVRKRNGVANINGNAIVTTKGFKFGEEWTTSAAGDETWSDVATTSNIWTEQNTGTDQWQLQG